MTSTAPSSRVQPLEHNIKIITCKIIRFVRSSATLEAAAAAKIIRAKAILLNEARFAMISK